jgi:hypothetical protein
MEVEVSLGYERDDVSANNVGYDIESKVTARGQLRFIAVNGCAADIGTMTIERNGTLTALYDLTISFFALSEMNGDPVHRDTSDARFIRRQPAGSASVNYKLGTLVTTFKEYHEICSVRAALTTA